MTDEDKGGSCSSTEGSAGAKNKTAKEAFDQALAENVQLRQLLAEKDVLIADLTKNLKETTDIIDGQEKQRLIKEILPRSSYKTDELAGKTVDQLKEIKSTLGMATLPKVNSVRFGVQGSDIKDRLEGLTVGDISWSTAQKRKAGAA